MTQDMGRLKLACERAALKGLALRASRGTVDDWRREQEQASDEYARWVSGVLSGRKSAGAGWSDFSPGPDSTKVMVRGGDND